MNCHKTGNLISSLRKEKGMTQQELADTLHISNKTVSKWETGQGCPDVSLWPELSQLLGADLSQMLQGELIQKRPDCGNIHKVRFHVCPCCGNIMVTTTEAAITCCGKTISPIETITPWPEDKITIEKIDVSYYITIDHPMTKEYYLPFVAYVNQDTVLLHRLYPEQNPSFELPLLRGRGKLYLYSTKTGLHVLPFRP